MTPNIFKILRSIVAGNRPTGHVYGEPYVNFADNQFGVLDSGNNPRDLIGVPFFASSMSFAVNSPCVYQGGIYLALVAVSPGPWNPAQWAQLLPAVASGFTTGDAKLTLKNVADSGWLMMNDNSIGSASSGANYANAAAQALFNLLYANISDANAPLKTSTGAATTRSAQGTAAAAWTANCRMFLTAQLGRSLCVAGVGGGLTARNLGDFPGAETVTESVSNMSPHTHGAHDGYYVNTPGAGIGIYGTTTIIADQYSATLSQGSGAAMNIIQPSAFWNVMIKL